MKRLLAAGFLVALAVRARADVPSATADDAVIARLQARNAAKEKVLSHEASVTLARMRDQASANDVASRQHAADDQAAATQYQTAVADAEHHARRKTGVALLSIGALLGASAYYSSQLASQNERDIQMGGFARGDEIQTTAQDTQIEQVGSYIGGGVGGLLLLTGMAFAW